MIHHPDKDEADIRKYILNELGHSEELSSQFLVGLFGRLCDRLVINANGHARPPRPDDIIDMVFIRSDGWTCGCQFVFEVPTALNWMNDWVWIVAIRGDRFVRTAGHQYRQEKFGLKQSLI